MKKTTQKQRISDQLFRKLLFDYCNRGEPQAHLKTNFFALLKTRYSINKTRSLKLHDEYYPLWAELSAKQTDAIIKKQTARDVGLCLASKEAMINFYQAQVETFQKQLIGEVKFNYNIGNRIFQSHNSKNEFTVPVQITNEIRKLMREYLIDISRMQGFYAPLKIAQTDVKGEDKMKIDTAKMPTAMLISMAQFILTNKTENNE